MAKNTQNAQIITSKDGNGLFYAFPVGTVTDLDPTVELPVTKGSVGLLSDAGVTLSESADGGNTISDSDGDAVRVTQGAVTRSIKFTIWEMDNPVALGLVYHPDDIAAKGGKVVSYDDSGRTPPPVKLVMEFQTDTDRVGRRTYHSLTFQSRGDEVINYEGLVGREVTYTLNRGGANNKFYETRVVDVASAPEDGE